MSWDTHILYLRLVMLITAHDNCARVHVNCARRTDLRRGVTNYIRQIDARAMRGHSNAICNSLLSAHYSPTSFRSGNLILGKCTVE